MARLIWFLIMFVGCASNEKTIDVRIDPQTPMDALTADFVSHGADTWSVIGVGYRAYDGSDATPECVERWFDTDVTECVITIKLTLAPPQTLDGYAGLTDQMRDTFIDNQLTYDRLQSVVAHEVGHSVFASGDHLPPGEVGIMMAVEHDITVPTEADLEYAKNHLDGWSEELGAN